MDHKKKPLRQSGFEPVAFVAFQENDRSIISLRKRNFLLRNKILLTHESPSCQWQKPGGGMSHGV
jgi:hypothetical protein